MPAKKHRDNLYIRIGSWLRSIGYFATLGLFGLIVSSIGPILPDLSAQVSVPLNIVSIIFTARALGFMFGSLLGGRVFDKYKGHPMFAVAFLILSLLTAFIPINSNFWILLGIVVVQGMMLGFLVVGASTFIVWEHAENLSPWLNLQSFINGMGGFLSPLIISFSISRFGDYSESFWTYAFLAGILAAYFLFLNSPGIRAEKEKESIENKEKGKLIYLMSVIFLLYVGAEVTFNGWVFTIATTAYTFKPVDARLLNSFFWGGIAFGRICGIFISKQIASEKLIIISFAGSIASILATIIFPGSNSLLWAATISMGVFMALIFPSLMMYAEKQMNLTGRKTGIFFSATSIGGMLMPWIAGQFYTYISPHAVKLIVFSSLVAGIGMFMSVKKAVGSVRSDLQ